MFRKIDKQSSQSNKTKMGKKLQLVKQRDRSGLEALTEASAFLGGIFFTALIFLVDKKEQLGSIPLSISQQRLLLQFHYLFRLLCLYILQLFLQ